MGVSFLIGNIPSYHIRHLHAHCNSKNGGGIGNYAQRERLVDNHYAFFVFQIHSYILISILNFMR